MYVYLSQHFYEFQIVRVYENFESMFHAYMDCLSTRALSTKQLDIITEWGLHSEVNGQKWSKDPRPKPVYGLKNGEIPSLFSPRHTPIKASCNREYRNMPSTCLVPAKTRGDRITENPKCQQKTRA